LTVLNLQVSAGADDGYWTLSGNFLNSEPLIALGKSLSTSYYSFIRFPGVSVPQGATVDDAFIVLQSLSNASSSSVNLQIRAIAADNAGAPSTFGQADGAARTSASVAWSSLPAWSSNTDYTSPSIDSVVQEVVNRGGWASGNAIVIYVEDNASSGGAFRYAKSYESGSATAPRLTIEYTPTNTAPTITVAPSVNYNGYTRLGPNNTPGSISFEAEDAEETGTDELTVEVRTAAAGGGTLVATDDYTSGTAGSISIAHNASGLSEGSNTLYMRVGDGTDWSDDESFTLLVDRTAPASFTPSSNVNPVQSDQQYSVSIVANDSHSTGTGELTVEVRTAASGGGTLLWTGSRTASASAFNTATFTDSGLVNGPNTRYAYVIDGAGNVREQSFTVTADFTVEIEATIAGQSTVAATLTAPSLIEATITGTSTTEATLTAAPLIEAAITGSATTAVTLTTGAAIAATIAGSSTVAIDLVAGLGIVVDIAGHATTEAHLTAPSLIAADIDGTSTVEARVTIIPEIEATITGSATTEAALTTVPQIAVDSLNWATVTAGLTTGAQLTADISGSASTEATISTTPQIGVTISGKANVHAGLTIIPLIEAEIAGRATTQVGLLAPVPIAVAIHGRATTSVRLVQTMQSAGHRLRVDIYDSSGNRIGPGPVVDVLRASYSESLDGIGSFELEVPAIDPAGDYLTAGKEVRIYREGEGLLFRGIVGKRETMVDAGGALTLAVTGESVAEQLRWANTLLGLEFSNTSMSSTVGTLLSGTGWTSNTVQTDSRNVTAQFEGVSIWAALVHVSEMFGWHVRERNLNRQVDVGKFGSDSGLIFRNVQHIEPDMAVIPVTRLRIDEAQDELWNRVIPIGGGEGINALTLQYSTRTSPYTVKSSTGPDGTTFWYLEDETSISNHGVRTKVLAVKDIVPLSNSTAEIRNAANTLYDVTAAWLGWHSTVQESYQVDVAGLVHMVDGQPQFRTGDTVRLEYRGAVEQDGERRLWRSIDSDVWVMGYTRQFNADGSDGWQFTVSTTDRVPDDDAAEIAKALEDLWAIKTAKRPFTFREIHGPYVESVTSGQTARLLVDFDSNITYLHQATLRLRKRRVKSNVTGAAAGGGSTSSAGGGQTTSSGGGQTSSSNGAHTHSISSTTTPSGGGHTSTGGSAHTHTVTGGTAAGSGIHWHQIGGATSTQTYSQKPFEQQLQLYTGPSGNVYGMYVERGGTSSGATTLGTLETTTHTHPLTGIANASESGHQHGILNHTHTVSGQTAQSGGSHTHTVSNHTHTVSNHTHTVPDHTHALVYGIFLGPTATTPQFTITINGTDRTSALGGPWDNDVTLDITQYLVDGQGHVLRQANNIDIGSSQLCDIEVTVRSLVTATNVVPV
jgi:hypothetical protein